MLKVHNPLFTTSEVSKICGVTKFTLFHYDDIGLLKPEYTNEKGYRYYSIQQCYELDIIIMLKKTGSSLQEIKTFIQNQTKSQLLLLIKKKLYDLEEEQNRLRRMHVLLRGAIEMTEEASGEVIITPILIENEDENYFVATKLEQGDGDKEFAKKLREHRDFCDTQLIEYEFPLWTVLQKEHFESNEYYPDYMANKLRSPIIAEDRMITKPSGSYVVMDHRGSYESMSESYCLIKKFITDKGLEIIGDAYALELLSYFSEKNPDDYIIRISVEVSRK